MPEPLSERDLKSLLDLVGEAHDAEDLDRYRAVVLPSIGEVVPAEVYSYNEVGSGGEAIATTTVPELPASAHLTWARLAHQNPLLRAFLATRDGRAYRISDVIDAAQFRRLEIYRELYRPLGIEHQVAFVLPSHVDLTIAIVLSRNAKDFSERDRRLLDLARPHLIQAYRNAELRERSRLVIDAIERGLDDRAEALLVLDGRRRVAFSTAAARALLALDNGRLPPPLGDWLDRGDAARASLVFRAPGEAVVARLLPGAGRGGDVIVFERGGPAVSLDALRAFGLTPREAAVLQLLARGHNGGEVAAELAISPRTVHKHCQRIYAKLGVAGRSQAVATAVAAVRTGR